MIEAFECRSSIVTLEGTPAGCGTVVDPPRFLDPGDIVTPRRAASANSRNPVVHGFVRTRPAA